MKRTDRIFVPCCASQERVRSLPNRARVRAGAALAFFTSLLGSAVVDAAPTTDGSVLPLVTLVNGVHPNCYPPGVSRDYAPDPGCQPDSGRIRPEGEAAIIAPVLDNWDWMWSALFPGQSLYLHLNFEAPSEAKREQEIYARVWCSIEGSQDGQTAFFPIQRKTPSQASSESEVSLLRFGQIVEIPKECEVGGLALVWVHYGSPGVVASDAELALIARVVEDPKKISGTNQADVYRHRFGEGSYVISDEGNVANEDVLQLEGVEPQDLRLSAIGDDLLVTIGQRESIRVIRQRNNSQWYGLEVIAFGVEEDSLRWTRQDILDRIVHDAKATGEVVGSSMDEHYVHQRGDGSYRIVEQFGSSREDSLTFRGFDPATVRTLSDGRDVGFDLDSGEQIWVSFQRGGTNYQGVDRIVFQWDGQEAEWTREELRNRVVADAKASGEVVGSVLSEEYYHNVGDGSYSIRDEGQERNADVLVLNGILPEEVTLIDDESDLLFILAQGETIRVARQRDYSKYYGLEQVVFRSDSAEDIVWTREDILARVLSDSKPTGAIVGSSFSETYFHGRGDGSYSIEDAASQSREDRLVFEDIGSQELTLWRDGYDLMVEVGSDSLIRVIDQLRGNAYWGLEIFEFRVGGSSEEWDRAKIRERMVSDGKARGEVIGTGLSDSYVHARGDGSYTLQDEGSVNNPDVFTLSDVTPEQVKLSADDEDVILQVDGVDTVRFLRQRNASDYYGVETFVFGSVEPPVQWDRQMLLDRVVADAKASGTVVGSSNGESYRHALGDGSYSIEDRGSVQNVDTLTFIELSEEEITTRADGNDVIITLENGESIRLIDQKQGSTSLGIERFIFLKDGNETIWERSDLLARVIEDAKPEEG